MPTDMRRWYVNRLSKQFDAEKEQIESASKEGDALWAE